MSRVLDFMTSNDNIKKNDRMGELNMSNLRYIYDYDALAYRVERRIGKQWKLVAICNTEQEATEFIKQHDQQ